MHIKIINPERDGRKVYDNTGTVDQLVAYLQHEAKEEDKERVEIFFDQSRDEVSPDEVVARINGNTKGVQATQEKFFSIVVSPSEDELRHIKNDDERLRTYIRQVMENYAQSFNLRDQQLHSDDLVWYATIHDDREVKGLDLNNLSFLSIKEQERVGILHNRNTKQDQLDIKRIFQRAIRREQGKLDQAVWSVGDKKPGLNKHVHIVVSRRDQEQEIMLNPRTRMKRFHIRSFQVKCARDFQRMFGYEKETIQPGFYQQYSKENQQYFREKIQRATENTNEHLGKEKLDSQRMQDIGERCQYSRAYFVNLHKLKYRAQQGNMAHDPYFFVERGRDQKTSEYFRTLDSHQGMVGKEPTSAAGAPLTSVARRLLQGVGGLNSGPAMIKETLLLNEERKRLKKHKERGKDGDRGPGDRRSGDRRPGDHLEMS